MGDNIIAWGVTFALTKSSYCSIIDNGPHLHTPCSGSVHTVTLMYVNMVFRASSPLAEGPITQD
jgi:hypothetical protein